MLKHVYIEIFWKAGNIKWLSEPKIPVEKYNNFWVEDWNMTKIQNQL